MPLYITPPPPNLFTRLIMVLVSAVVLAVSFMLGVVVLAVVAAAGLVAATALWLRVAWLRRRLRKAGGDAEPERAAKQSGEYIDAEYTVVRRKEGASGDDL